MIPFVFALVEEGDDITVYWAVDDKPKERPDIQRLANIEANPTVEFVVDHYDEDWTKLWWIRVRGTAAVTQDPGERRRAIEALRLRYGAYARSPLRGTVVRIHVTDLTAWSARDAAQHSTRS